MDLGFSKGEGRGGTARAITDKPVQAFYEGVGTCSHRKFWMFESLK